MLCLWPCCVAIVAGNCLNLNGDKEKAKELYLEAIGVEADCVEAIYNLGLVNKELGNLQESLQAFEKLHTIIPSSPVGFLVAVVVMDVFLLCPLNWVVCALEVVLGLSHARLTVHFGN